MEQNCFAKWDNCFTKSKLRCKNLKLCWKGQKLCSRSRRGRGTPAWDNFFGLVEIWFRARGRSAECDNMQLSLDPLSPWCDFLKSMSMTISKTIIIKKGVSDSDWLARSLRPRARALKYRQTRVLWSNALMRLFRRAMSYNLSARLARLLLQDRG